MTNFEKIKVVKSLPIPRSIKQLKGFLSLTRYYRRFIKNYVQIVKPLIEQLKQNSFQWNSDAQEAFEKLKVAMTSVPILTFPNFSKEFLIETYASGEDMQKRHHIAYISKSLSRKNQLLLEFQNQMLVILFTIKKMGVLPSESSLHHENWSPKSKASFRVENYYSSTISIVAKLIQYDYDIIYKKGKENVVTNALSRILRVEVNFLTTNILPFELLQKVEAFWGHDKYLKTIIVAKKKSLMLMKVFHGTKIN